jgi:hypothetical protein
VKFELVMEEFEFWGVEAVFRVCNWGRRNEIRVFLIVASDLAPRRSIPSRPSAVICRAPAQFFFARPRPLTSCAPAQL